MNATKWKLMVVAVGIGMLGLGKAQASPVDGSITVTPVGTVTLTLAPTYYHFGNVDVNISTVSISSITVRNTGNVSVTVDKQIQTESTPGGWTAGTAVALNTYVLYVATSTFQPNPGDFTAGDHRFGAQANVTPLDGLGGTQPTLVPTSGIADLWFRLDMPSTVTTQAARTITVRFTGTAQ